MANAPVTLSTDWQDELSIRGKSTEIRLQAITLLKTPQNSPTLHRVAGAIAPSAYRPTRPPLPARVREIAALLTRGPGPGAPCHPPSPPPPAAPS